MAAARPSDTVSVAWSLFWAFSAVVSLTCVGVLAVEQQVSARRERDRSRMLIGRTQDQTQAQLRLLLDPIERAAGQAQRWVRRGLVHRYDERALMDLFLPQMEGLPQSCSMMVSDATGYEFLLLRNLGPGGLLETPADAGDWITRDFRRDAWGDRSEWTLWDGAAEHPVKRWERPLDYDPRPRPWHLGPREANQARFGDEGSPAPVGPIHWTDVDVFFTSKTSGITASVAVRDPAGDLVVVGYDLLFSDLSAFTRSLQPTGRGVAFVLTEDGRLVGLPRDARFTAPEARLDALLKPVEAAGFPHLAAGMVAFRSRTSDRVPPERVEFGGEAWWFGFRPYSISDARKLWIAVAIPEEDLVAAAGDPAGVALVGLVATALAMALTFLLSRLFAQPLRALVTQSEQIAALDLAPQAAPRSRLTEVAQLSEALTGMRASLAQHAGERDRAEEARRETEAKHRRLIEHMPQSYFFYAHGVDRVFTYLSPSITSVLGYSVDEFLKHCSTYLTDSPINAAAEAATLRSIQGEQQPPYELEVVHRSGVPRLLEVLEVPVFGEGGEVVAVEGIARDVTERHAFEGALKTAKERAEAAARVKSQFLANMSHEIRTPLHAVLGFAELLERTELTAPQEEYVRMVRQSGRSLLALVNDILDFSKVESGRLELERQPFSLTDAVADTVTSFGPQVAERGLAIATEVADDAPTTLVGDRGRLCQVLVNLIGNAVKFTEEGTIVVRVGAADAGPSGPRVRVEVADPGIGIAADRQERLFSPFAQVDASHTRRFGGTGLGLAISRRLIEAMGGEIGVASEEGVGSTFWFTVPVGEVAEGEEAPAAPRRAEAPAPVPAADRDPSLAGLKVLIAEDNPVNARLAVALLDSLGVRDPVTVVDGAAAVEVAREGAFDLVLMDVQMPELDGLEASRRIHAELDAPPCIVAMTAGVLPGDEQACRDAGMAGFLSKPLDLGALRGVLVACLDRRIPAGARPGRSRSE